MTFLYNIPIVNVFFFRKSYIFAFLVATFNTEIEFFDVVYMFMYQKTI